MSDDKKSGVDPRFDAAFQRGFDQSVPIEEYVPPSLPVSSRAADAAPVVARPAGVTGSGSPVAVPAGKNPAGHDAATTVDANAETNADIETGSGAARNPFLLFLGLIAVALIVGGIWLFVRSGDAFNSSEVSSQGDYMSLDAVIHAAPFIALLGAATAIGILFVFAARYKRRR